MIDVDLGGVWYTAKAAIPHLIDGGGGSIILTSSANGLISAPGYAHYCAAKAWRRRNGQEPRDGARLLPDPGGSTRSVPAAC